MPKRAGWRPQSASHSDFLADNFSWGAIPLPNFFAPNFIWAEGTGPPMAMPRLKCGKRCSAHGRDRFQFRMVFVEMGPRAPEKERLLGRRKNEPAEEQHCLIANHNSERANPTTKFTQRLTSLSLSTRDLLLGGRKSADQRSPTEGRKPNGDVGWILLGGIKSGQKLYARVIRVSK